MLISLEPDDAELDVYWNENEIGEESRERYAPVSCKQHPNARCYLVRPSSRVDEREDFIIGPVVSSSLPKNDSDDDHESSSNPDDCRKSAEWDGQLKASLSSTKRWRGERESKSETRLTSSRRKVRQHLPSKDRDGESNGLKDYHRDGDLPC